MPERRVALFSSVCWQRPLDRRLKDMDFVALAYLVHHKKRRTHCHASGCGGHRPGPAGKVGIQNAGAGEETVDISGRHVEDAHVSV